MPTFQITAPDGRKFRINAPEGSTKEQALVFAQQQFGQQQAPDFSNVQGGSSDTVADRSLDPTQGLSGFDRFAAGMGKAVADTGRGLKQAGTDAARYFFESNPILFGEGGGQMGASLRQSLAEQQAAIDAARERDAPLMDTGAGLAGNVAGFASQLIGPGIIARGTMAARAALPTTVAGNAAQGGALGLAQPVASGDSRAGNVATGAALGAGGALAVKGLGTLARLAGAGVRDGRNALSGISPSEMAAARTIQGEAGEDGLAGLMRVNQSNVPGVQRTLGQESLNPGVMSLENTLRGQQATPFVQLERQNNLARVSALQQIAGDDAAMASAIGARSQAASAARDRAMRAPDVSVNETVDLIDELIRDQRGRPAVQAGLQQVRALLARESEGAPGLVTTETETSIGALDNVRKTIGDMLEGKYGGENAQALAGSRALLAVRDSLNEEIGRQVPEFTDYLNAYRQGSIPINRMELGNTVLNRASGPILDAETGAPILTPFKFGNAVRDLDATAAKATGFTKAKAADILTPDDLKLLSSIQDDLQRQASVIGVLGGGPPTNARGEITKRAARGVAQSIPWVGRYVEILENSANQQVQQKLAYLLANPAEARRVIAALQPKQRSAVNRALLAMAAQGGRTGSVVASQTQE